MDAEAETADPEEQPPSLKRRKKTPCQPKDTESKKVRYPTHVPSPLPHGNPTQDPYPALIWHKPSPQSAPILLKPPFPCMFHPLPQNQCLYVLTLFPYQVKEMLRKVKCALEETRERRNKGRKSTIVVCYCRQGKKKNENQAKKDEESLSSTPSCSSWVSGVRIIEESAINIEKALKRCINK